MTYWQMQISKNSIDEYFRKELKLNNEDEISYCFIFEGSQISLFAKVNDVEYKQNKINLFSFEITNLKIHINAPNFAFNFAKAIVFEIENENLADFNQYEINHMISHKLTNFCKENSISFSLKNKT
jgi:hypothetical protein